MPVTTAEAFLRVITKSRLVSAEQIEAISDEFASEDDPKAVARKLVKVGAVNKWQALQLLAGRSALMMGKYKLLDQIDTDEIRRTYLAEHAQMGRRVAVTTLSSKHTKDNPEAVKRFLKQARKLAALDHRNIVHVYDVDSQDDRYYVVMEEVEGRNLQEVLDDRGALPLETVARYVSQAASGLAYAHGQKHVHGALRPTNLLVDSQDDVKIANLGAAGLAVSKQDDSVAAVDYISPEQAAGESKPHARSDIYSLGCVMYALLTGHPPFTKGTADQRRQMHQDEQPPAVLDDRPDAAAELVAICEKMMAKDPSERYRAAEEIHEQLGGWSGEESDGEPVVMLSEMDEGDDMDGAKSKPAPAKTAAAPSPRKPQEKPSDRKLGVPADKGKPSPAQPAADKSKPAPRQGKPPAPKQQVIADAPAKSPKPPPPEPRGKKPAAPTANKPGEQTKATPSAGAPAGFAVDTKRRRRRKKGGAAPGADGVEAGGKAGIPTIAYIIGGAVGGLVLLTGVILLVVFLFSGGDGEEVAVADGEQATAENAEVADGAGGEADAEGDPAIDAEMDPEVDPVVEEESDPVPEADGVAASDAATEDPDMESSEDPPAKGDGADTVASKPADAPKSADGAGKKESVTQAKSNAGGDAKGKTEPKPEKKSVEKPAAKKPVAKKKAAKPTKKPFEDLKKKKYVPLPDVAATQAMPLGSVYVPSGELCFIKLRGGEDAFKGTQIFAMRNAEGGLAERDWEVFLREGEAGPDMKLAHLSLNDKSQLSFQWQPEAKEQPASPYLKNCAFSFSCSGESHVATLREPTRVEAAALDLEKPNAKLDWAIEMLPDPSSVYVEITGVQGAKYKVEPAPRMDADRGEAWVQLENGGGLLSLKVETSVKKNLHVTVTPHVKLAADAKPEKLNVRKLQQYKQTMQAGVQQGQMVVSQMEQAMKAKKVPEDQKRRKIAPRLALFKSELQSAQTALEKCNNLEKLLQNVKLTLSFRVFYDADTSEVDLLQIGS